MSIHFIPKMSVHILFFFFETKQKECVHILKPYIDFDWQNFCKSNVIIIIQSIIKKIFRICKCSLKYSFSQRFYIDLLIEHFFIV